MAGSVKSKAADGPRAELAVDPVAEIEALQAKVALKPIAKRWALLAKALQADGRFEDAIDAWRRVIELRPGAIEAHAEMIACLLALERSEDALSHLRDLTQKEPDHAPWWELFADTCRRIGEESAATALEKPGRLRALAKHIRRGAEHATSIEHWRRAVRAHTEDGDLAATANAWRRLLEINPHNLLARERLLELEAQLAPKSRGQANAQETRIFVLGNCQALNLSQALRLTCRDVKVQSLTWPEIDRAEDPERLVARLEACDVVIAQPPAANLRMLRPDVLRRRVKKLLMFPRLYFTGFHPDLTQIGRAKTAHFGSWHSELVMAAHAMGLPKARAADLFNAYIYGVLGYFDEFAKSEAFLIQEAEAAGLHVTSELADWKRLGAFVHVPNHPRIEVSLSLAAIFRRVLGLSEEKLEALPSDPLRAYGAWPVYPEIAKRIGVDGSLRFQPHGPENPPIELDEMIDRFYAGYEISPVRSARTEETIARLRSEGV